MPAECSTCTHHRIEDIHRGLDAGDGVNATARAFGIPPATLKLHLKHRPVAAPARAPAPEADEPEPVGGELPLGDLDGRLRQVTRTADRLRKEAEDGSLTPRERGAALGECRRTVETMIDLAERIAKGRETDLLKSAQWAELRSFLLETLLPYPKARAALVEALARFGGTC